MTHSDTITDGAARTEHPVAPAPRPAARTEAHPWGTVYDLASGRPQRAATFTEWHAALTCRDGLFRLTADGTPIPLDIHPDDDADPPGALFVVDGPPPSEVGYVVELGVGHPVAYADTLEKAQAAREHQGTDELPTAQAPPNPRHVRPYLRAGAAAMAAYAATVAAQIRTGHGAQLTERADNPGLDALDRLARRYLPGS